MTPQEARAYLNDLLTLSLRQEDAFGPLALTFLREHDLGALGLGAEEQFNLCYATAQAFVAEPARYTQKLECLRRARQLLPQMRFDDPDLAQRLDHDFKKTNTELALYNEAMKTPGAKGLTQQRLEVETDVPGYFQDLAQKGRSWLVILVVTAFLAQSLHAHANTVLPLTASPNPEAQVDAGDPPEYEEFLNKFKDQPSKGMVLIPSGQFMMGSERGASDEQPRHLVALGPFYMDKFEVTQKEFEEEMGSNPSIFISGTFTGGHLRPGESRKDYAKYMGDHRPVERVTWKDAQEYCQSVGKRLPTEAEWEYAARAGSTNKYYWGDKMDVAYVWNARNARSRSHLVGEKKPNAFGLYDMSGNVMEWVADWYDKRYYSKTPLTNPKGPATGRRKVLRGGSWYAHPNYSRSADRVANDPTVRYPDIGFRCVLAPLWGETPNPK